MNSLTPNRCAWLYAFALATGLLISSAATAEIDIAGKAKIFIDDLNSAADDAERTAFFSMIGDYSVYGFEDFPSTAGNEVYVAGANPGSPSFRISSPDSDVFKIINGTDGFGAYATEGDYFLKIGNKPEGIETGTEFIFDFYPNTTFLGFDITDAVEQNQFGTTKLVLRDGSGDIYEVVLTALDTMDVSGSAFGIYFASYNDYTVEQLIFSYDNKTGKMDGIGLDRIITPLSAVPEPGAVIAGIAVTFIGLTVFLKRRSKKSA